MLDWYSKRDWRPEIMDDLDLGGATLEGALKDIEKVNRWLGGYQIVLSGLKGQILGLSSRLDRPLRITDLGCGGGDTLRYLARYCRRKDIPVELIGIDANENVLDYAQRESEGYPEISFRHEQVLESSIRLKPDIVLCSLFLHHFQDAEVIRLLKELLEEDRTRLILVNDLHRHPLAYFLFQGWSLLFGIGEMARHDGLLSVRKAFRRSELESYIRATNCSHYRLRWRWAFRWQLLLFNHNDANIS